MFIGGLHQSLNKDILKNYFSQFGKIDKGIIMKDKITKKSREFGFIIFSEKETIYKILSNSNNHFLYGKWIEYKKAKPKFNNHIFSNNKNDFNNIISHSNKNYNVNLFKDNNNNEKCFFEKNRLNMFNCLF